ncbi:SusC/RagA family TonB-linked outer membrane protein [Bacteroides sp. 51]|nr:SusC/RagA family TonB-linked outer membrane protein [Bacteroides sp. 51]
MIYKEESRAVQQAKTYRITGTVLDETGAEVIGANITVPGTTLGTITNVMGEFSIDVPEGRSLEISFIGYIKQTFKISKNERLSVVLREDATALTEVVVTALGIKREAKALGYAVSEVSGSAITASQPINAMSALSGKVAGVDISSTTAGPSGSTRIVIRGNAELSGYNQPLYVIDGVPMDNSQLGEAGMWGGYDMGDGISGINPEDIESLSVLKGASAAALYGSRATHGVVLITTKSANKKGFGIDVTSSVDFVTQLSKFDDYQREYGMGRNGELPISYETGRGASQASWGAKLNPNMNTYIFNGEQKPYGNVNDNISSFFRTGTTFNNSVSVTSASDKASIRASVSDMRNNDIVPKSNMNRNSFMIKADANITSKFRVETRVNYITEKVKNRPALSDSPNNVGLALIGLAPNLDQKWLADGYKNEYGDYVDWNGGNIYRINPYWSLNEMFNRSSKNRIMGYMQASYEFIPGLTLQVRGGTDSYKFRITEFQAISTPTAKQGAMSENSIDVTETNAEGILRYTKRIGKDFDLSAFVGGNMMFYKQEMFMNTGENQVIPDMYSITNYSETTVTYYKPRKRINSVYGAVNLGYKDFLYIDATLRNDWTSTLPKGNNSYMYPSVSGSFIFTNVWPMSFLSFGKLRASWAQVGGDTNPYMLNLNYGLLSHTFNGKPLGEISSTSIPPANLKPTRTYSYEVGADLRFLNNRMRLDIGYYSQRTKDQIMNLPVTSASGFENSTVNSGEILNQGIELSLNVAPISTKDFYWDFTLNFARNVNEVVRLHDEISEYPLAEARWAGAMIQAREGDAYGVIIGKKLLRTEAGEVIYGENGYPLVGDKLEVLGNGVYDWTGGLGTSLSYKGFSLSALFDVKWGADVYSMSSMMAHSNGTAKATLEGRKEWYNSEEQRKQQNIETGSWTATGGFVGKGVVNVGTVENPKYETNTKAVDPQKYWTNFLTSGTPEPFIYDASFIKLREMTLSYTLKKEWLKKTPFTNVAFTVYGRNLWTIYSDVPNIDPESSYNNSNGQGFEYGSLPSRRSFGFNLKFSL